MSVKSILIAVAGAAVLAGCSSDWETEYETSLPADVTRDWNVTDVQVMVPETLTVSDQNRFAPDANIVWHGDPPGDRRAQVAAIVEDGLERGTANLNGSQDVVLVAAVQTFHGVTPLAVSQAPGAVHNITYVLQAFESGTGEPLTKPTLINADLEAFTGAAAVIAAQQGQTQKVRVTDHIAVVTRGWLGVGPDPRRSFGGFGR